MCLTGGGRLQGGVADQGMIQVQERTEQDNARFHQATQNGVQFQI